MVMSYRGSSDEGYIVGDGTVTRDTVSAILFNITGETESEWYPKSQIHEDSDVRENGDSGTLIISSWLAEQKGFL